jgi:hypothetical protein
MLDAIVHMPLEPRIGSSQDMVVCMVLARNIGSKHTSIA